MKDATPRFSGNRILGFIALSVLALGAVLFMLCLDSPHIAQAQEGSDVPCSPPKYERKAAIPLTTKAYPARDVPYQGYVFDDGTVELSLDGDEIICLSSSADRLLPLWVDDKLTLKVTHTDGAEKPWSLDFQDPIRKGITTTLPTDISHLFARGKNKIYYKLEDTRGVAYGASHIWLHIWNTPVPVITSPRGTEAVLKWGESITIAATTYLGSKQIDARIVSARAEITRNDGRSVPPREMLVSGNKAESKFSPEPPEFTDSSPVRVSIIVRAKIEYWGRVYDTSSQPVVFDLKFLSVLAYNGPSMVDFGNGLDIADLKPVTATVRVQGSEPLGIRTEVPGLPWLIVQVEPDTPLIPQQETVIRFVPTLRGSPPAPNNYTGTLLLKTNPSRNVVPIDRVTLRLELGRPKVTHTVDIVDFGTVFDLEDLKPVEGKTFALTNGPVEINATVKGLDWLKVEVQPRVLPPKREIVIRLVPQAPGSRPPSGSYTGQLSIKARLEGKTDEIDVTPSTPTLSLELKQPTIRHSLERVLLDVDDIKELKDRVAATFALSASFSPKANPVQLSARLTNEEGHEINEVYLELTPSQIKPSENITVSMKLKPGSSPGPEWFWGRMIKGSVVITGTGVSGLFVTPKEPVQFDLYERSRLEVAWRNIGNVVAYAVGLVFFLFILSCVTEFGWLGWRFFRGGLPQGTLRHVVLRQGGGVEDKSDSEDLSRFSELRHRLFGVLIAYEKSCPYYSNNFGRVFGWVWEKVPFLQATSIDILLEPPAKTKPQGTDQPNKPNPRIQRDFSRSVRIVARGNEIAIINMDDMRNVELIYGAQTPQKQTAVPVGYAVNPVAPSRPQRKQVKTMPVGPGQVEKLEHNVIIHLQGRAYRYWKPN